MPAPSPKTRQFGSGLVLVVLIALALRLHRLDAESLYMDEIVTVETFPRDLWGLIEAAAIVGQPPLDNFLGKFIFALGLGHSDWWVRFPAVIFGGGAVLLLGLWVRRIGGSVAGLAAALLLAVCPLHAYMSQEVRPYSLMFILAPATGLTYIRARERQTVGAWLAFAAVTFAMLMTRWTDPHFVILGIGLHALAKIQMSRHPKVQIQDGKMLINNPDPNAGLEHLLFRRTVGSILAAYACYAPFFFIVLSYQRVAVRAPAGDWTNRFSSLLYEAFAALFAGYSTRTVFTALPGSRWLVITAASVAIIGLILALVRARQARDSASVFWWIFVPFPFAYALVYALLGDAVPKPQYLLIMAIPVITCIAFALSELLMRLPQRAGPIVVAVGLSLFVLPMAENSWAALERVDKRDWRGAMGFLKDHAAPGDVAVCLGSDTVAPTFRPKAYGKNRYGSQHLKFIPVSTDTPLEAFSASQWQSRDNTLWLLVYTDRMYTGVDQLPPPRVRQGLQVHTFNGLFVVGLSGADSALERLMDAFGTWLEELPDGRSFAAPAVLRWRWATVQGDNLKAAESVGLARRQCTTEAEVTFLEGWITAGLHSSNDQRDMVQAGIDQPSR